jgi:hypothetical protein
MALEMTRGKRSSSRMLTAKARADSRWWLLCPTANQDHGQYYKPGHIGCGGSADAPAAETAENEPRRGGNGGL